VEVDISAGGTKAQGVLTMATKPTAGDTVTIGATVYTFVVTADSPGEVTIGAAVGNSQANLSGAIAGTDGINPANGQATSAWPWVTDALTVTARHTGVQGNSIDTLETFTDVTDAWDAATLGTLTAGVDVTATQAGDALVAALAGDATGVVTGVNTTGTVVLTAKAFGPFAYTTTETMANGSFGAATMSGGASSDNAQVRVTVTDATAETITIRFGQAQIGGVAADYSEPLQLTHA